MTQNILVLGGSTFMGKQLLEFLNSNNKGRKYWNNHVKSFVNLSYYNGNRQDRQEFTKLIQYIGKKNNISQQNKWHAIIDFSAFKYPDVQSVKNAVQGLCNLYLFISTDSIFKWTFLILCYSIVKSLTEEKSQKQIILWICIIVQIQNKLKCEMYLQKYKNQSKFPYISLILPDIIGSFDDTGRYWAYLKWIQSTNPVDIDEQSKTSRFSLVYSHDVVKLIYSLIQGTLEINQQNICQSYNLGFKENICLQQLLKLMSQSLNLQLKTTQKQSAKSFYPSVDYGYLNLEKATKIFNWNPTPLKQAIKETTHFFITEGSNYKTENEQAQKKLKKKIKT